MCILNGNSICTCIILWKTGIVEVHGCMSLHAIDLEILWIYQLCYNFIWLNVNCYLSVAPDLLVYPWYTDQSSDQVKCHKLFSMKSLKKPTKRCVTKQSPLSDSSYSVLAHTAGARPYNKFHVAKMICLLFHLSSCLVSNYLQKIWVVMFNFMITT